jgi:hypothetical protein
MPKKLAEFINATFVDAVFVDAVFIDAKEIGKAYFFGIALTVSFRTAPRSLTS